MVRPGLGLGFGVRGWGWGSREGWARSSALEQHQLGVRVALRDEARADGADIGGVRALRMCRLLLQLAQRATQPLGHAQAASEHRLRGLPSGVLCSGLLALGKGLLERVVALRLGALGFGACSARLRHRLAHTPIRCLHCQVEHLAQRVVGEIGRASRHSREALDVLDVERLAAVRRLLARELEPRTPPLQRRDLQALPFDFDRGSAQLGLGPLESLLSVLFLGGELVVSHEGIDVDIVRGEERVRGRRRSK
jgi:hypothetical protein